MEFSEATVNAKQEGWLLKKSLQTPFSLSFKISLLLTLVRLRAIRFVFDYNSFQMSFPQQY